MKILMITGGNIDRDFAFSFLKENKYDKIIAVDGGLAFADSMRLPITHLVGDFDTIDSEILERYIHREDISVQQYQPEKDYTDTDIGVKLAMELFEKAGKDEMKELHVFGATGTRLDHVLANLQMLKRPMEMGIDAKIIDKNNQIQMIQGSVTLKSDGLFGKYVSLIPATQELQGITLEGFKYPLNRASTLFGESLCVSNELVAEAGRILIEKGYAWLILSRD
ncbi:MAG: thiamine diphosphokinase [Clostridia bacterium]|nr:thiamine diphosphokinase [Lachnospiraceae bacterium]NCC00710.1 thiamine diphosphokinase [Clostridia bacterium]NCD02723.1 thiamine diphosphokinase [Clostridia bacterium]